ncbi:hypothetical protein B0H13DRAFT_1936339 [Mycena leptocephala]|nr:hypothetical protein B0H13DRAFT_1936339 [Mycena leptocephala]
MQEDAENRHKAVLNMIEALSDRTSSDGASSVGQFQSSPKSSNDMCIDQQVYWALTKDCNFGWRWNGKDKLGKSVIHHSEIAGRYDQQRFFVACDSAATQVELAALIGTHIGLKPGKDLTRLVIQQFSSSLHSLLILDNLETLWEPTESRANIEEFYHCSQLTLKVALMSYPIGRRRKPLSSQMDMTKDQTWIYPFHCHCQVLALTLSTFKRSSQPPLNAPNGLSDAELVQAQLPIDNILGCKAALIRTTLAYSDEHKRLKALVPIQEYLQKIAPPGNHLVRPLLKHFHELLELFMEYRGTQSNSATVARISSNYSNIQNILWNGAQQGHPDLVNTIYCACDLNHFSLLVGRGTIDFSSQIHNILPQPRDHRLEAYYILSLFNSFGHSSISVAETLVAEALEHFKHFDDPDLKCRLYNGMTHYYRLTGDTSTAKKYCETAISLAHLTRNTKLECLALASLAQVDWYCSQYFTAEVHANEAQRLARISADLYGEAQALRIASVCCHSLGNYKQSISLCSRARYLVALCGMSSGQLNHAIMGNQAEIHKLKSEYGAARSIHSNILQETSMAHDSYTYGFALLNVAEIDVSIGAPKVDVQSIYEKAREIFNAHNLVTQIIMCDVILADLHLREGNRLEAKAIFESCLKSSARQPEIMSYCLDRLGDISRWGSPICVSDWTTVFLVHSVRQKEKLGIHKALQFLGNAFLAQDDEHTAINLLTVALEGFTYMDVHRSRAECIFKGHGDLLKAVELWETARPLFEWSSQAKQVTNVDQRLAGVSEDVLERHRKNLACLAELIVPSGTVDEIINLSDIEDMDGPNLEDETALDPVAL